MPLTWDDVAKIKRGGAYITRLQMQTVNNVASDLSTQKAEPIEEWPFRLRLSYDAVVLFKHALTKYKLRNNRYPRTPILCQSSDNYVVSPLEEDLKSVSLFRIYLSFFYASLFVYPYCNCLVVVFVFDVICFALYW